MGDGGCTRRSALLVVSLVPAHALAQKLAPWLVTSLPPCSIILERHTHKNGGSTLRSIINQNSLHDDWTFWGYGMHQHEIIAATLTQAIFGPSNVSCDAWSRRAAMRLVAEHHYSRVSLTTVMGYFGPASPLQQAAVRCSCKVVLVTRLREPLSYYISFYRWTVSWRQRRNSTTFGATMLEWAPRNLQTSLVLRPLDATWAEFVGVNTPDGQKRRETYSQFDEPGVVLPGGTRAAEPGEGRRRRAELRGVLSAFDLVGLVERFDETLLMLADMSGLQKLLYTRAVPGTTNHHYKQPSVEETCPSREACERRIKEVAPFDHEMYTEYAAAFDARIKSLGEPFQQRVRAFQEANKAFQANDVRKRAARKAQLEAAGIKDDDYDEIPKVYARRNSAPSQIHTKVPMDQLRCGLGNTSAAIEACQRIYADTPFRYNWLHTRTSCCDHIHSCLAFRLARRRPPNACYKWIPDIADPGNERQVRGKGYPAMKRAVTAALPTLCDQECSLPADTEPKFTPYPYRSPERFESAGRVRSLAAAEASKVRSLHFEKIGCNDTPPELLRFGKPWPDFGGCTVEGKNVENLRSKNGPCAHNWWVRANCKKTCGLCGMPLRQALELPPRAALRLARVAARQRAADAGVRHVDLPKIAR